MLENRPRRLPASSRNRQYEIPRPETKPTPPPQTAPAAQPDAGPSRLSGGVTSRLLSGLSRLPDAIAERHRRASDERRQDREDRETLARLDEHTQRAYRFLHEDDFVKDPATGAMHPTFKVREDPDHRKIVADLLKLTPNQRARVLKLYQKNRNKEFGEIELPQPATPEPPPVEAAVDIPEPNKTRDVFVLDLNETDMFLGPEQDRER